MLSSNTNNRIVLDLSKPKIKTSQLRSKTANLQIDLSNIVIDNNFNNKKTIQNNTPQKLIITKKPIPQQDSRKTQATKKTNNITNKIKDKQPVKIENKRQNISNIQNTSIQSKIQSKKDANIKTYENYIPKWYKLIKEKQIKQVNNNKIIITNIIHIIKKYYQNTQNSIIAIIQHVKKYVIYIIKNSYNNIIKYLYIVYIYVSKKIKKTFNSTINFTTQRIKYINKKIDKKTFKIKKISINKSKQVLYFIKIFLNNTYNHFKKTLIFILPKNKFIRTLLYIILVLIFICSINTIYNYNKLILLKDQIKPLYKLSLANVTNAKTDLISYNIQEAQEKLNTAQTIVDQIKLTFNNFKSISTYISFYAPIIIISDNLIDISFDLINLAKKTSEILSALHDIKINEQNTHNIENINKIFTELEHIQNLLTKTKQKLSYIPITFLSNDIKDNIIQLKKDIVESQHYIDFITLNKNIILDLLGYKRPMTYMILLQNNNEIRPTGGFIGSVAIINTNNGNINIEFKDIYDYDGQFKKFIEAPDILKRITPNFSLRDANFYPDFEISAKQINWFFENSGGYSLDFIISINQNILKDLLNITGPISLPQYKVTIDSNNYLTVLMLLIEAKHISSYPKQILFDLGAHIISALNSKEKIMMMPSILKKIIKQRDMQIYSSIPEYQNIIKHYNIDGNMLFKENTNIDFSSIIVTSISGNKSDRYIKNKIYNETVIAKEGSIFNTIKYSRTHTWNNEEETKIKLLMNEFNIKNNDKIIDILGRGTNIGYIRIYLPLNSSILSTNINVDNYKITNELGYTVFSTLSEIKPGETFDIELSYLVPKKLFTKSNTDTYYYYYQKQSGLENATFVKKINVPENIEIDNPTNNLIIIENITTDIEGKLDLQLQN